MLVPKLTTCIRIWCMTSEAINFPVSHRTDSYAGSKRKTRKHYKPLSLNYHPSIDNMQTASNAIQDSMGPVPSMFTSRAIGNLSLI
jgi:hypothetical protein